MHRVPENSHRKFTFYPILFTIYRVLIYFFHKAVIRFSQDRHRMTPCVQTTIIDTLHNFRTQFSTFARIAQTFTFRDFLCPFGSKNRLLKPDHREGIPFLHPNLGSSSPFHIGRAVLPTVMSSMALSVLPPPPCPRSKSLWVFSEPSFKNVLRRILHKNLETGSAVIPERSTLRRVQGSHIGHGTPSTEPVSKPISATGEA